MEVSNYLDVLLELEWNSFLIGFFQENWKVWKETKLAFFWYVSIHLSFSFQDAITSLVVRVVMNSVGSVWDPGQSMEMLGIIAIDMMKNQVKTQELNNRNLELN